MKPPKWIVSVVYAVLVLAVPIALFFSPLYPLVTPAFVHWQYKLRNVPPADIYAPAERIRLSDANLRFLQGAVTRAELEALLTDAGNLAMLPEEVEHMADVKAVMDAMYLAHGVALALGLIAALLLWFARQRERIGHALRRGVAIVGVLVALVLASSLIDFDAFFTVFHGLFFEAGTWTFYAEDTLIQLYPLPFWMNAVLVYGALVLVGVALTYALSFLFRARRSHPEAA